MAREYKDSGIEWIGRIPKKWKTCRFKNFMVLRTEPSTSENKIGLENIESESGHFIQTEGKFDGNGVQFHKGEIVYGKLRPYLRKVWLASFDGNAVGDFFVFRNKNNSYANYLKWLLLSDGFAEAVNSSVYGAKMPRVSSDFILTLPYCIPPLPEQQRIADYLDKKCGEIDELISLQEQMIAQLTDYKQSVITEAVTKGLNPDAELVPSGIDWIGDVPKGWRVAKAKYFVFINNGSDPQEEGDIPVYGSGASSFKTCGEHKEGPTVLIGRKGATLHIPHYIEGKYWNVDTAFDVKIKKGMSLRFYYYLAICFDYKYYISQTTLPGMAQSSYYNMNIPLPPLSEQQSIATYLDTKCSEIDSLISIKQQKIETLKDYKKSVIYEAVTGKMTV